MKDSEFIELLNLYLDHEISASDAVRLEAEVQGNLARRRIYEQYCRMQKACKVLAYDFQTETLAAAERKVVPFEPAASLNSRPLRTGRASGLYTLGTFAAAAACVALVLVSRSGNQTEQIAPGSLAQKAPLAAQEVAASSANSSPRAEASLAIARAPLVGAPLTLSGKAQSEALQVAANEETNARFAWMTSVQLEPLQMPPLSKEPMRFDPRPKQTQPGVYTSPEPLQADVHMSAFRFQR